MSGPVCLASAAGNPLGSEQPKRSLSFPKWSFYMLLNNVLSFPGPCQGLALLIVLCSRSGSALSSSSQNHSLGWCNAGPCFPSPGLFFHDFTDTSHFINTTPPSLRLSELEPLCCPSLQFSLFMMALVSRGMGWDSIKAGVVPTALL